jgi:hypothetical protein
MPKEWGERVWTAIGSLSTWTGGRLLWTRWWTFGFHKECGISWETARVISFSVTMLHGITYLATLSLLPAKVTGLEHRVLGWLKNNEFERMWKEIEPSSGYLPREAEENWRKPRKPYSSKLVSALSFECGKFRSKNANLFVTTCSTNYYR